MATHGEDDLFKHTSMTFGEHLEELRAALFKAVIALVIGFAIGLVFGSWIVQAIQVPLYNALRTYYEKEAVEKLAGQVPAELRDDEALQKAFEQTVYDDGLYPEQWYFSPEEMLGELKRRYPQEFSNIEIPENPPSPKPTDTAKGETAAPPQKPAVDARLRELRKKNMIGVRLWRPLSDDERLKVNALGMPEPFVIYMKASFLFGALISSPFVFYFLWQFVAAGLYPHEKKYIHTFLPVSVGLFLAGAAMAFFFVFPPVLGWFFKIGDSIGIQMRPRLSEWLSFVLLLPLGFGVAFQLPLVMLFLERIHLLNVQIYLSKWRIAVLVMAVAAMVLSPGGDPISMMMMLAPLIALYFGGIALCQWLPASHPGATTKPNVEQPAGVD